MKKLFMFSLVALLSACSSGPKHEAQYSTSTPPEIFPAPFRDPAADTDLDLIREGGPKVNLEKCGGKDGSAVMTRVNGSLYLRIRNMDCKYYKTAFMNDEAEMNGTQGNFWIDIPVNEDIPGWRNITFGSKNYFNNPQPGSKADILRFYVPARVVQINLWGDGRSSQQSIPNCKGTIEGKINNGTVNLIFRNVTNCTKIVLQDGNDKVEYSLQDQGDSFGGSFSVPKRFVDTGANVVNIYLYGKFDEARLKAYFLGVRW